MSVASVVIRRLEERPAVASRLAEWFAAEWPGYHKGKSLGDVASQFRLRPDQQETLIAEVEGEPVGTVSLRGTWDVAPDIPPPWIGGLFVVPDYRGRGIGRALVDAAIRSAAEQGYPFVHMSVSVDPASYLRRGWGVVGTVFSGEENVTVLRIDTAA